MLQLVGFVCKQVAATVQVANRQGEFGEQIEGTKQVQPKTDDEWHKRSEIDVRPKRSACQNIGCLLLLLLFVELMFVHANSLFSLS